MIESQKCRGVSGKLLTARAIGMCGMAIAMLVSAASGRTEQAPAITVKDLCDMMEIHMAQIEDIQIAYTWTKGRVTDTAEGTVRFVPEKGNDSKNKNAIIDPFHCIWKERGHKAYLERRWGSDADKDSLNNISRFAWNGTQGRTYSIAENAKHGIGLIAGKPNGNLRAQWKMPFLFGNRMWNDQGETLVDLFKNKPAKILSTEAVVNGHRCAIVLVPDRFAKGVDEKYWLDLDRGCSLVRFERTSVGQVIWSFIDIVLKEVSPNIWYPVHGITYVPGGVAEEYSASEVAVNQRLPDSAFTLAFPPGTHVTDRNKRIKYVVPGHVTELELARIAELNVLEAETILDREATTTDHREPQVPEKSHRDRQTAAQEGVPPAIGRATTWWYLLAITGGIVVAIAVRVLRKRAREG